MMAGPPDRPGPAIGSSAFHPRPGSGERRLVGLTGVLGR